MEDPSVIKLTRPYENGDSLKRMNWRLLARGQGPTVNQYEVVSPRALHFILDGESLRGHGAEASNVSPATSPALEDVLCILASLLLRLSERGMEVGVSFPATDRLPAANLFAGAAGGGSGAVISSKTENHGIGSGGRTEGCIGGTHDGDTTGEILYRMAAYQFRQPVWGRNPDSGAEERVHLPSLLAEEELVTGGQQVGTYYFITYDTASASASGLLPKMVKAGRPVEILTYESLCKLRKGSGQ